MSTISRTFLINIFNLILILISGEGTLDTGYLIVDVLQSIHVGIKNFVDGNERVRRIRTLAAA